MIEDEELREIYELSSTEHLNSLEMGLLELEKTPNNEILINQLFRDAHSLKGDSRITGVIGVEMLSHTMEEILGRVKKQQMSLTAAMCDRLYQLVDAMTKLVHEAVTDEPSGVNYQEILDQFSQAITNPNISAVEIPPLEPEIKDNIFQVPLTFIEDADLREIYQLSSQEHLEKITTALEKLNEDPQQEKTLEELLLETERFSIDSRMVGREDLEIIIEKITEILQQVQQKQLSWTQVSERVEEGVKAIAHLVQEAITGEPSPINSLTALGQLSAEIPPIPTLEPETVIATPPKLGDSYHIDTLRVPTRHLDTLMTQTGELNVTSVGISHITTAIHQIAHLWEEWQLKKQQNSSNLEAEEKQIANILDQLKVSISDHSARLDFIATELDEKVRTLRLLPLSTVFLLFPRMVRDLAQELDKPVNLVLEGGDTNVDKQVIEEIKDPLMHLLRNAIDHGIESPAEREKANKPPVATLKVRGYKDGSNLVIEVSDDGRGLDPELIKQTALKRKLRTLKELEGMSDLQLYNLIFAPGFSTRTFITEISGRGVGLDVVRANVERLKGTIKVDSQRGLGTRFSLHLGTTLSTAIVMLLEVGGIVHALPQEYILTCLLVSPEEIFLLEGHQSLKLEEQVINLANLATLLQLVNHNSPSPRQKRHSQESQKIPCIVIEVGQQKLGLLVDNLLDLVEVVIKPPSKLLKGVPNISGATILANGEVCMILNPSQLIESFRKSSVARGVSQQSPDEVPRQMVILLVEDSIAVRTQEKRILEKAGYQVVTAVDGLDGLQKLQSQSFDAIISDVEMPHLNGFAFTLRVRENPEYRELPIVLVTSLASEQDKRKGAEVGANAYIVKDQFNQEVLLETLERLV